MRLLEELNAEGDWNYLLSDLEWISFRLLYPVEYKYCILIQEMHKAKKNKEERRMSQEMSSAFHNMEKAVENTYALYTKLEKEEEA